MTNHAIDMTIAEPQLRRAVDGLLKELAKHAQRTGEKGVVFAQLFTGKGEYDVQVKAAFIEPQWANIIADTLRARAITKGSNGRG